ncbi:hypothetical protein AB0N06_21535 [Streptomyces sp. NPDC051020]|uniref:hypothetical protein n=1 Tax=Streptomyces sp. NPDC051020 TaxID=3155409 RepID=UPI00342F3330
MRAIATATEPLSSRPLCPGTHGGSGRCGAGELAHRAGTTAPNARHHIIALRDSALVTSQRHRKTTVHTVTRLGHALLHGRDRLIPV